MTLQFVYRFDDVDGAPLYVGCTQDVTKRLAHHRREQPWWGDVASISVEIHPNLEAGRAAEAATIARLRPKHNVFHAENHVLEFGQEFFDRWSAGETLASIGAERGWSKQYVDQIIKAGTPGWLIALAKRRNQARTSLRRAARTHAQRVEGALLCFVCGHLALGKKTPGAFGVVTCGPECSKTYATMRLHIDGRQRETLRQLLAATSRSDVYRSNMEAGTVKSQGEWFVRGSAAHRLAHDAYRRRLPLFDALTPAKREQVISEATKAAS